MSNIAQMKTPQPRILCVDSDRNTIEWIRNVLKNNHISTSIKSAVAGRDAFTLLNRGEFDLCIFDYALPDMTGAQLCSLVRYMGCEVSMMVLTAMDRPVDRRRATECGADAFLVKPDDLDMFCSTVVRLLDRRRSVNVPYSNVLGLSKAA